ncbi:MAG: hypothetical protein KAH01_05835 [Caldisericia bacterium]|nr:hypothetical protein [Caldisericia bacterium]
MKNYLKAKSIILSLILVFVSAVQFGCNNKEKIVTSITFPNQLETECNLHYKTLLGTTENSSAFLMDNSDLKSRVGIFPTENGTYVLSPMNAHDLTKTENAGEKIESIRMSSNGEFEWNYSLKHSTTIVMHWLL